MARREEWIAWARTAEKWLKAAKERRARLIGTVDAGHKRRLKDLFRCLFATDCKRAHAVIAGKGAQAGITGLHRPDGTLTTSRQELASLAHRFFSEQAAALSDPSGPQEPPWQDICFDGFDLVAEPLQPGARLHGSDCR